jgi:hypothetical protein
VLVILIMISSLMTMTQTRVICGCATHSAAHTAADTKQLQLPFAVIHTLQSCMHAALCTQSAMSSNTCTWSNPFHHSAFDLTPAPSSRALQACRPLTTNIRQKWQCSL